MSKDRKILDQKNGLMVMRVVSQMDFGSLEVVDEFVLATNWLKHSCL